MLKLTIGDPRLGTTENGKRIPPALMVNGSPFDRGSAHAWLPLGDGYWVVLPSTWNEDIELDKPTKKKETVTVDKPKRKYTDVRSDDTSDDDAVG
jgi:hypothetical protein